MEEQCASVTGWRADYSAKSKEVLEQKILPKLQMAVIFCYNSSRLSSVC